MSNDAQLCSARRGAASLDLMAGARRYCRHPELCAPSSQQRRLERPVRIYVPPLKLHKAVAAETWSPRR